MSDEAAIAVVLEKLDQLEAKVDQQITDTRGLVEAWRAAGGLVKFVKLLSTLVAAAAAVYVFFRHGPG